MTAPTPLPPAGAVAIPSLPLAQIRASLTNPRKHFDAEYITGLAQTIRTHGVIQPITVRPWPASRPPIDGVLYEIVVGECRQRASLEAGKEDIPAYWREIGDKEAVELQIIENLKRRDINALEEAEGYRVLMKEHGHTADSIAEDVGQSRAYIYARLKLLDLCPAARKRFEAGELDASRALLVARIPVKHLQEQAAKEVCERDYRGEMMSYRTAAAHIQRRYMLKLAEAPFARADALLVPSAGRCHDCAKRTGNDRELYADVDSLDVCTDPDCYEAKKLAHVKRQKEAAEAAGKKVISGKEAEKIKPHSYSDLTGGYVDLDKEVYSGGKFKKVRDLLGKEAAEAEAVVIDPHKPGKLIEVATKATIKEKLEAKGITPPEDLFGRGGKSSAEKEAERKRRQEATYRQRLFDQIRSKLVVDFSAADADTNLQLGEYRLVAGRLFHLTNFDDQKRIARLWIGPTDEKQDDHALIRELAKRIPQLERGDVARLLIELSIVGEVSPGYDLAATPDKMLDLARGMDIDAKAIKTGVIAEAREKEKAKKPAAKKAAPAAIVQPKTAKPGEKPATKTTSTPDNAARATDQAQPAAPKKAAAAKKQTPASPAEDDESEGGSTDVKTTRPAKAAKSSKTAPAKPANEKAPFDPVKAWPFPTKKAEAKPDPAPATPANEKPGLKPTDAWPFPTGARN